jgi:hypothetical protein
MNSLAHNSPIVEGIVFNIISKYAFNITKKDKHVLNTDIVPAIHEKIIEMHKFTESMIHSQGNSSIQVQETPQEQLQVTFSPVNVIKKIPVPQAEIKKDLTNLPSAKPWESYKRIFSIIKDPQVTHIECKGPNSPLVVLKGGRNQVTNINLSRQEIDEYLNFISEKTRLPLVEGVFHALVEDYYINAIISSSIEPSFIIKKNTVEAPYYAR